MRSVRNCNVVVVGGAGFLGSHLVDHLVEDRGCRVLVIDNLEAGKREFVHPKAEFAHHDITGSEEHLFRLFDAFGNPDVPEIAVPDFYVFNYAARPYVPDSYDRPLRTCDVNFMGAMKVINAAQEAGADGILQVSSAEIYGCGNLMGDFDNPEHVKLQLDENSPVEPHSSYGASKAVIDALVQVRWKEAKIPCIALRQFNCVGERETHPYIVPEIISQLNEYLTSYNPQTSYSRPFTTEELSRHTPTIRLGNNSFRDFLYAGDAVRIAVELLERGQFGEVYNLGSETGIKIYDLAKLIGKLMGFIDVKVGVDEARIRPWEIWSLLSCNEKLWRAIMPRGGDGTETGNVGCHNLLPLEEALKRTIAWYNSNRRKWSWQ